MNQLDRDGASEFSNIVVAKLADEKQIEVSKVFPNPVKGIYARIKINSFFEQEVRVLLFNGLGALVSEGKKDLLEGTNYLRLNVRDLVSGSYFVKIQMGQEMWYRKILVQ